MLESPDAERRRLRVGLFGDVFVSEDGVELDIGGLKARAVLAVLAVNCPRAVDTALVVDAVWGDRPPSNPQRDLRTIVSRLRRVLGPESIVASRGGGYRLTIPRQAIDIDRLERLVVAGSEQLPGPDDLRQALAATAGEPLGAVATTARLQAMARSLEELRGRAENQLAELLVDGGAESEAIRLLEQLLARTPLDERRWALLITALARAGRVGDALRGYQRARETLVSTLGVEPGAELRSLELAVLNGDLTQARKSVRQTRLDARQHRTPETRYVEVDGLSVAYQVWGHGPIDVVLVPQLVSHLEVMVEIEAYRHWIESLAAFCRLIVFDKRGNGMSDRISGPLLLEHRTADIGAVMDAVGVQRAALLGVSEGGTIALLFAALHPDRVSCVATAGSLAAGRLAAGIWTEAEHCAVVDRIRTTWGTGNDFWIYELAAPTLRDAPLPLRQTYERLNRISCTPSMAALLWDTYGRIDITAMLDMVRCPVLVHHREDEPLAQIGAPQLIAGLRHAERSTVPGSDHAAWTSDVATYVKPIREFLQRNGNSQRVTTQRTLLTIVAASFSVGGGTDLVTAITRLQRQVTRSTGRLVESGESGIVASFALPSDALGCVKALRDLALALDLDVRHAVHTGEIEVLGNGAIGGATLEIVMALSRSAAIGEILVSDIVRQLAIGSHHQFDPIGEHLIGERPLAVARLLA